MQEEQKKKVIVGVNVLHLTLGGSVELILNSARWKRKETLVI